MRRRDGDPDHLVANLRFLGGSFRTESNHYERSANLCLFVTAVPVHCGDGGGHLGLGVAHDSSRRATASLSRIRISNATRGETSPLASASLRRARVIPGRSRASIRPSSSRTIDGNRGRPNLDRPTPGAANPVAVPAAWGGRWRACRGTRAPDAELVSVAAMSSESPRRQRGRRRGETRGKRACGSSS